MARKTDDSIILKMLEEGHTQKAVAQFFKVSPAAISKRVKRINAVLRVEKSLEGLTDKQKNFVIAVANGESATNAALSSFDCKGRDSAKTVGKELVRRDDVNTAISVLLAEEGLTRRYRVQKLKGHVNNVDPGISLRALDQTWRLDGEYAAEKHVHVVSYADLTCDAEELRAKRKKLEVELGITDAEYTESEDEGEPIEDTTPEIIKEG